MNKVSLSMNTKSSSMNTVSPSVNTESLKPTFTRYKSDKTLNIITIGKRFILISGEVGSMNHK